jgi:hypothetical protein
MKKKNQSLIMLIEISKRMANNTTIFTSNKLSKMMILSVSNTYNMLIPRLKVLTNKLIKLTLV